MPYDLGSLRRLPLQVLVDIARTLGVENPASMRRQDLVALSLQRDSGGGSAAGEGVLEILQDGFGFLRAVETSFSPGTDDVYVSPSQIRRFNLRTGDMVRGQVRSPKENERYFALIKVESINEQDPELAREKMLFDNLTAQWPRSRFILEHRAEEASTRMIDLFCPIGRGARVLVVAPQRAGRTTLLQNIARGIAKNHPTAIILSLLAGERPEDISDSWAGVPGQVMATALDESDARHLQVADITIERAKRLVEGGKEVVILVDSLTRLARAAQGVGASTGRVLIGGWDPLALQRVRGFLGAARALKEGGSLTIIAAVLAGTGIKSDETLLEDLRGVENTSIVLDKALADRRIFPAIDVPHSGTLREELLWTQAQLQQLRSFRGTFPNAMGALGRVSRTRSNAELLDEPPKTGEKAG